MMNIGEAARASGVSSKMIRHYEQIGLLPQAVRRDNGYRLYGDPEVQSLRFIRHARSLGFGLETVRELLSLWQDESRASRDVHRLATEHLQALQRKAEELRVVMAALQNLVSCCHGDARPDCPILEELAGHASGAPFEPPT
ncbi:Cu(I)-responsive transcriptional regulator [Niveibacterium sp. SC-1]|uniref:Cu(I)-responsive transcriptional regulator n=1 Tax=Niveibacterium sp. SC-1 TaxID=3135646 RepID=UPI00311E4FB3